MTSRLDRLVLAGIQVVVVGVPLFLGGNTPWAPRLFAPVVVALLVATLVARVSRRATGGVPGGACLAVFLALGFFTTLPMPPAVIEAVSPATARLYRDVLPGWPGGGGWTVWRALAFDPWAVWTELLRFSLGFGVYVVLVAYPWRETTLGQAGATRVLERILLTLLAAGLGFSALGALEMVAGNGSVLWVAAIEPALRLAGPFVNPDHFAGWIEMMVPVAACYAVLVLRLTVARLKETAGDGRAVGVRARRAWASAVLASQRELWVPLVVTAVVLVLLAAHGATDSRGGRAALFAGLLFATVGFGTFQHSAQVRRLVRRAAPALALSVLALATAGFLFLARHATEVHEAGEELQTLEVDLGSRLAVADRGTAIVMDFPFFGTGLGSWVIAFSRYQRPPVEDGIWDHAHNDYLELTAETGLLGTVLVLLFAGVVARAARSGAEDEGSPQSAAPPHHHRRRRRGAAAVVRGGWRRAFRETGLLRWGIAGGIVAILVHSFVDFSLRMPGNLVLLMTMLGLLVLLGRGSSGPARVAPAAILALVLLAGLLPVADRVRMAAGLPTLSPERALEQVDDVLSAGEDAARAVALARWAVDRSPADRDVHRAYAEAVGSGDEAVAALRRALRLDPWASDVRDMLALELWGQGRREEAVAEIEESLYRYPHIETHGFLSPSSGIFPPSSSEQLLQQLIEGGTLKGRLAQLDAEMIAAIERGLRRARDEAAGGAGHGLITEDLITLFEAKSRFAEAAAELRAAAATSPDASGLLDRAAAAFIKVGDLRAAEDALLNAISQTPDRGTLYRNLAVEVYARRGEFDTAETVLEAGGRNATDMVPVYRGMTELLSQREAFQPEVEAALPERSARLAVGEAAH